MNMVEPYSIRKSIKIAALLTIGVATIFLIWNYLENEHDKTIAITKHAVIPKFSESCSKGIHESNYENRVSLLTQCIESKDFVYNSGSAIYFFKRGFGYDSLKKYNLALNDYQKAIELNPKYSNAYHNMGIIYHNTNKYALALRAYNKAIEFDPKLVDAYYNRGQLYREKMDFCQEAVRDYNQVISLNKNYYGAYFGRGVCRVESREYKKALEDFNIAIEINPKFAFPYNSRGCLFFEFGKFEQALDDYNKALLLSPNNFQFLTNRALLYSETDQYQLALEDFLTLIKLYPNEAKTYYSIGLLYKHMGKISESVESYEKAIDLNPQFTWSYNNLAEIFYSSTDLKYRNPEKAVNLLLKALEISGPRVPAYNQSLAAAYAQLGQFQKSIEYQSVAVDIARERGWDKTLEEYQKELEAYKEKRIIPIIQ